MVYEKPFGTSPAGFRALNRTVHRVLDESQVYRIDHFLGKESTQNLHVLRFANEVFAAMWNREQLRTGKRMAASEQRVTIVLRTPQHPLPGLPPQANALSLSLAGDGEIALRLLAKKPGVELDVQPATIGVPLAELPHAEPLPPYVRLIHDVLLGDRSLFTRPDGLAAAWRTVQPILDAPPRPATYPQGSWGGGAEAGGAVPVAGRAVESCDGGP
ncbi:hypothetical protein [Actinoplanes sp. NPDC049599]|uniref:hypothetical protein n=1 Tax=Actinoplanes sp. NPDC049599 TaxID=3363903 RepID=UPI00378A5A83